MTLEKDHWLSVHAALQKKLGTVAAVDWPRENRPCLTWKEPSRNGRDFTAESGR